MTLRIAFLLCLAAPAAAQTLDRALLPVGTAPPVHFALERAVGGLLSLVDPLLLATFYPPGAVRAGQDGRVLFPVKMEPRPGVHLRNPNEAWGMPETLVGLQAAALAVHRAHYAHVEMIVGDISLKRGGRFPPHHTHRNGRDVDLRYWIKGVEVGDYEYNHISPVSFDPAPNWTFVKAIYDGGWATDIYVDVKLQKLLFKYATKRLGLSPEAVAPILSWPYAANRKSSLVKHVKGHHNHFHVRFSTPISDFFGRWFTIEQVDAIHRAQDLAETGHFEHVVRAGETLGSIAEAHSVPLKKLLAWNRMGPRSRLRLGKKLKIYSESAEP